MLIFIFALLIIITTVIAGIIPFKAQKKHAHGVDFPIGETLATGVFLGAGLLHMLPESTRQFSAIGYEFPVASLITGLVFLLFLWFEHVGKELYHHNKIKPTFALLAWFMLCIHSLILGSALGMNHQSPFILMLFLAIITHKWAESFAIAVQLTKSGLSSQMALVFFILFTLMTPFGIFIGTLFNTNSIHYPVIQSSLIAASAGTFLYLGTLHGLDKCVLVERCCNLKHFTNVILGFLMMAGVAYYV